MAPAERTGDPNAPHRRFAHAVMFAIRQHDGQTRRDGTPYVEHPIRVAESLRTIGGVTDEDIVIAALLHDVIEDTECSYDRVSRRFGDRVAGIVAEVSADMRIPKADRKREAIDRVRTGSEAARIVKLADRLDNLEDMVGFTEAKKHSYLAESREIHEACQGVNTALENALSEAIERVARALS